ncbi:MAG: hypothetical protein BGN92_14900 [Sphingobacteriales bacterium 41-5]|nr:MAG: hypothetical protein BGN92_14900 [Sphingobacteriales bacterium 41-5]
MRFNKSIRKIIAIVTLVVFTISITPKKYFHDIFFHHTDELFVQSQTGERQVHSYQYNCGFVNIIALTPFLSGSIFVEVLVPVFFTTNYKKVYGFYRQNFFYLFSLRGPPFA